MKQPTGSVKRRGAAWLARITWTDPVSGKRAEKSRLVSSKNAGSDRVALWRRQIEEYGTVLDRRVGDGTAAKTFDDLAAYFESRYAVEPVYRDEKKISGLRSWKTSRGHVAHLRPLLGPRPLRSLTYADLDDVRLALLGGKTHRGAERSIAYTNRVMSTLRRMLAIARQRGWMAVDPFALGDPLIRPSHEVGRQRVVSREEEVRLLKQCEPARRKHYRILIIAAIETGMRQAELLAMTPADVDLGEGVITVRAMNTKTLESRIVPVTARLRAELEPWLGNLPPSQETVIGIRNVFGWRAIRAGAGLSDVRFHDLRHTAGTRMVEAGVPEAMVGRILGQKIVQTTRRYVNLHLQAARDVAAKMDAARI